jgi:putative ABC transport system permease protein
MAFGYTAGIMLTWSMAAEALMLAVGTTLAASAYPAWKAARLEIVDALRKHR